MHFVMRTGGLREAIKWAGPLLLAAAVAAGGRPPAPNTSLQSEPNVILITIDTLRADRLGAYGNTAALTPTMDALGRDGVVFRRAIVQVPLTLPSHTAILTGTYPMWNGVEDLSGRGLGAGLPTLAEIFKRHGYATAAFVSAFVLESMWGLNRGFDLYDDWFKAEEYGAEHHESVERRAAESVDHALGWLASRPSPRPFFLWLHLYDPHAPYTPPEPFKSSYRGRPYDGEVAYTDHELGRLIEFLKSRKLYASSAILLASDHGEGLGEHQEQQHGFFIYGSTVHVPLILKPPATLVPSQRVVTQVASSVDIAPTLAQLCRFPAGDLASFQGHSLVGLLEKNPAGAPRVGYSESLYPRSTFGWHSLRSIETDEYHYIDAPHAELYDLKLDPNETRNLIAEKPAVAAALRQVLDETLARYRRKAEGSAPGRGPDPEAVEKLRSLGYLSLSLPSAPQEDAPGAADPKDEIGFYNQILRATELAEDGRLSESNAMLQAAGASHPTAYLVPFLEGENLLALGQAREAIARYRRALELSPMSEQAAMGLGHAAYRAGDNDQAIKAYELALALNPANYVVRLALGKVYLRLNRFEEAAKEQQQVLAAHPRFALAYADYGVTLVRLKRYDEARRTLEKAVELGSKTAYTYNFLGNAYLSSGRSAEALHAYQEAIRLDPNYATAYLNLAVFYLHSGQADQARPYYQKACRLDRELCRQLESKFH